MQLAKPDIVFLDIEMPVMGGFEFLGRLNNGVLPAIVMVTAYDQHAIHAFEAGAIDYLTGQPGAAAASTRACTAGGKGPGASSREGR